MALPVIALLINFLSVLLVLLVLQSFVEPILVNTVSIPKLHIFRLLTLKLSNKRPGAAPKDWAPRNKVNTYYDFAYVWFSLVTSSLISVLFKS